MIPRINELINQLAMMAIGTHYECEDSWYSCPQSRDGCSNDTKDGECDCGRDSREKKVEEILSEIQRLEAMQVPK